MTIRKKNSNLGRKCLMNSMTMRYMRNYYLSKVLTIKIIMTQIQ